MVNNRRLDYGRCADQTFRVMGGGDVDLLIGGCAANLQRRLSHTWRNQRHENDSTHVAGNRDPHGDADHHGRVVFIVASFCESLGKHRRRGFLFSVQRGRDTHLPISIRQISSFR